MSLILIANNDRHQKALAHAFSLFEENVLAYSKVEDLPNNGNRDITVCLLDGQDSEEVHQLAIKTPVFAISELGGIDEEERVTFHAIFYTPLRLGRIIEAVRLYKKQKSQKEQLNPVVIGELTLDPKNNSLSIKDSQTPVRLTEKEQYILLYLYENKGKPVGREALLANVWGYVDGVETHTLETHIYRLRQKIETDPSNPDFLMTNDDGYYLNF